MRSGHRGDSFRGFCARLTRRITPVAASTSGSTCRTTVRYTTLWGTTPGT
ncbi:hypothetical protein ACFFX0_32930 [Citricoccus parietis]|uniref:Uncharacterized protein n=1 Tax=Citricoccus parietis TaxID=592307 RepID=A0ABV5G9W2_9MICC